MGTKGKLLGIATRPAAKAPMTELALARITTDCGVGGDARGKPGRRQVTVMTRRAWEAARAQVDAPELHWTVRRANLLVDGIELHGKMGYDLRVGDAVLTITGETRPCKRMNSGYPGLMGALEPDWRGGVTCRVIRSGDISVGCEVAVRRFVIRQLALVVHHRARRLVKRGRGILVGVVRSMLQQGSGRLKDHARTDRFNSGAKTDSEATPGGTRLNRRAGSTSGRLP